MPRLNPDQANAIADQFVRIATAVCKRITSDVSLTKKQKTDMENMHWSLMNYAADFRSSAVRLALENIDDDLQNIQKATTRAKNFIAKVDDFARFLRISATLLQLGGAIMSKNPTAIAEALINLNKAAN